MNLGVGTLSQLRHVDEENISRSAELLISSGVLENLTVKHHKTEGQKYWQKTNFLRRKSLLNDPDNISSSDEEVEMINE